MNCLVFTKTDGSNVNDLNGDRIFWHNGNVIPIKNGVSVFHGENEFFNKKPCLKCKIPKRFRSIRTTKGGYSFAREVF